MMVHDSDVDDSDDDAIDYHYKHQSNQYKRHSCKSFADDDYYKEN